MSTSTFFMCSEISLIFTLVFCDGKWIVVLDTITKVSRSKVPLFGCKDQAFFHKSVSNLSVSWFCDVVCNIGRRCACVYSSWTCANVQITWLYCASNRLREKLQASHWIYVLVLKFRFALYKISRTTFDTSSWMKFLGIRCYQQNRRLFWDEIK